MLAALAVQVAPAGAQTPPGKGLSPGFTVVCDGQPVTVVTPLLGRAAWADGQQVVLQSVTVSGPDGTFTRTFGEKAGLPTITCVESISPFTYTYVAALVPARGE